MSSSAPVNWECCLSCSIDYVLCLLRPSPHSPSSDHLIIFVVVIIIFVAIAVVVVTIIIIIVIIIVISLMSSSLSLFVTAKRRYIQTDCHKLITSYISSHISLFPRSLYIFISYNSSLLFFVVPARQRLKRRSTKIKSRGSNAKVPAVAEASSVGAATAAAAAAGETGRVYSGSSDLVGRKIAPACDARQLQLRKLKKFFDTLQHVARELSTDIGETVDSLISALLVRGIFGPPPPLYASCNYLMIRRDMLYMYTLKIILREFAMSTEYIFNVYMHMINRAPLGTCSRICLAGGMFTGSLRDDGAVLIIFSVVGALFMDFLASGALFTHFLASGAGALSMDFF